MPDDVETTHEAAVRLGVSDWTVTRYVREGKLTPVYASKPMFFAKSDIDALVMERAS